MLIERGLRGVALGRKSWLFGGFDRGGQRVTAMYRLIITAKMSVASIRRPGSPTFSRASQTPSASAR